MMGFWEFITIVILVFALFMVLAGAFTAYFGSGRSRAIGAALLIIGLVVGIIWVYLAGFTDIIEVTLADVIWNAFLYILAAIIGALIAVGIFLVAIMKS
ncbi:MAG: hypothetical protein GKC03_03720 [Methanomassiliicoccales archaeon]|jgi:hypothetical protein|nr:hypothetical protein [Methanomassiliicoccales archaeon]NYT15967.1 hypothetical protein [Methanomassiliicoccales archaeon]